MQLSLPKQLDSDRLRTREFFKLERGAQTPLMLNVLSRTALVMCMLLTNSGSTSLASDYCVVCSKSTMQNGEWQKVVSTLVQKHEANVLHYESSPSEVINELRQQFPRYSCFVAKPDECSREFVADVHKLTRTYDDDPYTDTFWGILTGYDANNALKIAQHNEPLTIRRIASGTEVALEMCEQGLWYDELVQNKFVRKQDGRIEQLHGPDDTTAALVDTLNTYEPDLFVTSGHATERNWQIGFRYRNGYFKSSAGQMYGEDTQRKRLEIKSNNPKVYLPIGNCLMGHIDGPDAMALAWMNDAGVRQMIGYTVPTWFGYGGWGVLDYFVEQPGRYNLTEAFFANHQALLHAIETETGSLRGLKFDRDVVAFYGDPKWEARMADAPMAYDQTLTVHDDRYTMTVTPKQGADSFKPINTNGAQRGWRPIVHWLPHRINNVRIVSGSDLKPVITDDFVLIPNPRNCDDQRRYEVIFLAEQLP